ncbi:Hypothetical protein I595_1915 [Croceitalea dokdonensis DOKDO 023]|uniref:Nudix hydrolase domain-containing protein n=1 Tax=Croceitalea dokdonensis DOKDO 023 TaxID=1300341 RepID=A0A0P7A6B0_9FLAO|nr:hypothetical protein [Croceitalea dokdonensis]KPM32265.1 Hypothetical protein I595_1915 [Croceitalea dokdonensis DOKDO 023]
MNKGFYFILVSVKKLRGMLDRMKWLRSEVISFVVFIALTIVSILELFEVIKNQEVTMIAVGKEVLPFLVGLIGAFISFLKLFFSYRLDLHLTPNPKISTDDLVLPIDFQLDEFEIDYQKNTQAIIYNPKVNLLLNDAKNTIVLQEDSFDIHPVARKNLIYLFRKMPDFSSETFDQTKVRLTQELTESLLRSTKSINVQKTSYYRDRLSNSLANYKLVQNRHVILNLRDEFLNPQNNEVLPLNESKLSNQLGASTLLVTGDKKIVFLMQGKGTNENKKRWAPSGSGSFDFVRPTSGQLFTDYCLEQAKRELREESNIEEKDIKKIAICGFGRYIYRNGKPEIFCLATTDRESSEIKIRLKEWDYQDKSKINALELPETQNKTNLLLGLKGAMDHLNQITSRVPSGNREEESVSGPLYWNVKFAYEYVQSLSEESLASFFDW